MLMLKSGLVFQGISSSEHQGTSLGMTILI